MRRLEHDEPVDVAEVLRREEPVAERPRSSDPDRFERLYGELRRVTGRLFASERTGHTLQPTAVANEAWIRLARSVPADGDLPSLALLTLTVRHVLVDHARARSRLRRGGDRRRIHMDLGDLTVQSDPEAMVIVGDALETLGRWSDRAARVVELRLIAGCTDEEVAMLLGVHRSTIARDWRIGRLWLRRALSDHEPEPELEPEGGVPASR